ncbi:segregation and condensation protein A [Streptomyces winkii]|uniref:segregation and condensation protein A n=1 Tax=Streptomyces winkii TaxID=3051178 RepID=UPI0028D4D036|nr:segregation/condensation protein A [Streptomyces sp. DSM 40971]
MPSPDDHAEPTPRAARRTLGRGPGASSASGAAHPGEPPVPAPGGVEEPAAEREPEREGAPEPEPEPAPAEEPAAELDPELPPIPGPEEELAPEPEQAADEPGPAPEPVPDGPETASGSEPVPDGPESGPDRPGRDGGEGEGGSDGGGEEQQEQEEQPDDGRFKVVLDNFEGPFDLLLQLISKHKLDVTEVALSKVTDEFMAYIHAMGPDWDLDQTTEFLVVASTLLDLKAARLLPAAEVEDEADLALLEARDLLFARLLQYRAYKEIAAIFAGRMAQEAHRHPRTVGLEPHHAELLPEVAISIGPEGFARLAVKAMQPKPKPQVYVEHIHAPLVSVREQAEVVVARLRELGEVSFLELTRDAPDTLTVVARFLALLELYRERAVTLEQEEALGSLMVRWSGEEGHEPLVTDEFDQEPGRQDGTDEDQEPQARRESAPEEEMQP